MRKRIFSCTALALLLSFIFVSMNTIVLSAQTGSSESVTGTAGEIESKEEVIYTLLDTAGAVNRIYAVNILNVSTEGQIADYGTYTSIKNLTSTDNIETADDLVALNAPAGRFYYQGTLSDNNLPWSFTITYSLDNTPIEAADLAGKSGNLIINIKTAKNPNIASTFFDHYLLQVSVTLDTDRCSGISAPGATLANAGTNKLATFTVMPGTESNLAVNASVEDFEMDSIVLTAVPFSMNIELPDTTEFTDELTLLADAISQLNTGISSIKDGVEELSSGMERLKSGSFDFKTGLDAISGSSEELISASKEISGVLTAVSGMLTGASSSSDLAALSLLPSTLSNLSAGLDEIAAGLTQLDTNYSGAYSALASAIDTIPKTEISEEALQTLMMNNTTDATVGQLVDYYTAARTIQATYQLVSPAFEAVSANLPTLNASITKISDSLDTIATQLATNFKESDLVSSITQLSSGLSELAVNYESFHSGLESYTNGVGQLADSYPGLNSGISDFSGGVNELNTGMKELKDGAAELSSQTAAMPDQIDAALDKLMSEYDTSDFVPVSFTSKKNNKVISVQFILKTDAIKKLKTVTKQIEPDHHETFWTRLKALFFHKE